MLLGTKLTDLTLARALCKGRSLGFGWSPISAVITDTKKLNRKPKKSLFVNICDISALIFYFNSLNNRHYWMMTVKSFKQGTARL